MSRLDFGDFHDHATEYFNSALEGIKVKGIKVDKFKGTIDSTLAGKVTASIDYDRKKDYFLTATVKANSKGEVKPSVAYEKGEHKLVTNYNDVTLKYQYKVAALGGAITTNLIDGLCSDIHASTVLTEKLQAGFSATYDPSRSGLKKFSYGVVANNPCCWKKGSLSLTTSGPKKYSLGASYQCCSPVTLLAQFNGWRNFDTSLGFKYTSPCGALVAAYTNIKGITAEEVEVGVFTKKNVRGFDVSIGALINPKTMDKKFGATIGL